MKKLIRIIVHVVYILSLCCIAIIGILSVIYEIIGYAKFEQLLSSVGISHGFKCIWLVGLVMFLLLIIIYVIKSKIG